MKEDISAQLKKAGLGDYEAMIYAVLAVNSPASATFIAKRCNLSRSSVYTALAALIAKGLVGTTYRNEIKQFVASDVSALEQLLKKERGALDEKFRALESVRGFIKAMERPALHVPDIIFFEGQEGLKRIYLSMVREAAERETMYILRDEFVWQDEWKFIFGAEWHDRVKRLKAEKDIRTKLVVNDSPLERGKVPFYRTRKALEVAFLPKDRPVKQFALYMLGDIISILSMEHRNLVGIRITNRHLSDNFKQVFASLRS